MSLYPQPITPEQGWHTSLPPLFALSTFLWSHVFFLSSSSIMRAIIKHAAASHSYILDNKRMNENPRMLVAFCLEKCSIANCANMLDNMLVQMLANMLARFVGALSISCSFSNLLPPYRFCFFKGLLKNN